MKQNLGTVDRALRAAAALVLAILYFSGVVTGTVGVVSLVIGGVLLATAVTGFCPLYVPFRISTRRS